MATPNLTSDMAQFFDFGEAALSDMPQEADAQPPIVPPKRVGRPSQGDDKADDCLDHDFYQDFAAPPALQEESIHSEPEWNPDFSSWIPRYQKPTHPCEYCRSKSLECFIYNAGGDGSAACSPCNALFRPCSFSDPEKMTMQKSRTALDTLDVVTENSEHHFGGLTGKKQMRSLGHVGPIEDDLAGESSVKKGAAAARFPHAAVKILKDWMVQHIEHPYPSEEEKEILKAQTGLTINQISNWMANTRRRQKARPKRSSSPSIRPSTEVIDIPPGRTWESLNPFERWKHSPPENEPAPMTAIAQAVEKLDLPEPSSTTSSYRKGTSNDSSSSFSVLRAPSTTSLETGFTNMSSGSLGSHNSAYSYGSRNSFGSLNSLSSKKERRRRRRVPTRVPKLDPDAAPRIFQCTFCTDRFKSKYDWSRHEKSLHLSLEKWICAPLGEVITCSSSGRRKCVYCDALDPTKEHLATHNHGGCEEKGLEARTFYRKDHLRQHLRLMHGCRMIASMESWKAEAQMINSRCGFCGSNFDMWQDRVDHLAKEFRNGADMRNWKGCRGLDPHVASQVTNAMPPYLIAIESKSPLPFSATNSASMKQQSQVFSRSDLEFLIPDRSSPIADNFVTQNASDFAAERSSSISPIGVPFNAPEDKTSDSATSELPSHATCWEILTLRLGRYAREFVELHGPNSISDDMLQEQARRILYDSDDPWNQTAADNPEWLGLFKKAHGIDARKAWSGTTKHHDILEDLGLRPDAMLDRSFDLSNFDCIISTEQDAAAQALSFECALSGSTKMSMEAYKLTSGQNCIPGLYSSSTTSPSTNIPATTYTRYQGINDLDLELACTMAGGICGQKLHFPPEESFLAAPIGEQPCTKAGEPTLSATEGMWNPFSLKTWDRLPAGFEIQGTAAGTGTSVPASTDFGNSFGDLDMGMGVGSGDAMGAFSAQGMRWDDSELGFSMDMDMDVGMELDMNTDLMMAPTTKDRA